MKNKGFIPINLGIKGKKVVVVGGGKIAEKRVNLLLGAGAKVLLISPRLTKKLSLLSEKGEIEWIGRRYKDGDLKEAFLGVFAASDSKAERNFIKEAQERKILVNVASNLKKCDFIFPAVARSGEILVSVSTQGAFPLLSAVLAQEIGGILGDKYSDLIDYLLRIREEVKGKFPAKERKKVLKYVLCKKHFIIKELKAGRTPELEDLLI